MGSNTNTQSFASFPFLVDAALAIEKLRVAAEVRQTHLKNNGREDPETDTLFEKINNLKSMPMNALVNFLFLTRHIRGFRVSKALGTKTSRNSRAY